MAMANFQGSTEALSNAGERELCRYANKGTCSFRDDKCRYRHEKCENYSLCLKPGCLLAHAPSDITQTVTNKPKDCFHGIRCHKPACNLHHPQGWSACNDGAQCIVYDCTSTHPPGRRKKCDYGNGCRNKNNCNFLHPNEKPAERSQETNRQTPNHRNGAATNRLEKTMQHEATSNPEKKQSSETIELSRPKYDFLLNFGNAILGTIRKQTGVKDVKLEDGKVQVYGNSSAITNAKSHLEEMLFEQNVTIATNLKKYLELSAKGRLLKNFLSKYRAGIAFHQTTTTNAPSTTSKMVTIKSNEKPQNDNDGGENQSEDDSADDDDDDNDDNNNDIPNATRGAMAIPDNVKCGPNCAQKFIQVTLCSDSNDSISKAIKELQSYSLCTQSWCLTQDEIAYILKQPQKSKPSKQKLPARNRSFQVKYYLNGIILSMPNAVGQIFVKYQRGVMRVSVKGFKNHVNNAVSRIKTYLADNVETEVQLPISKAMAVFLRTKASSDIKKLEKSTRIKITIKSAHGDKHENNEQDENNDSLTLVGSSSQMNSAQIELENFLESLSEEEKQFPCPSWDISKNISQAIRTRLKDLLGSDDSDAIGWIKIYTAAERRQTEPNIAISIVGSSEEAVEDVAEQCQNIVNGHVVWNPSVDEYRAIHHALIVKKSPSIEEFRQQWKTVVQLDRDTNTITIPASSKEAADDIKEALLGLGGEKKPPVNRITEFIPIPLDTRRFVNQAISSVLDDARSQKIFIESKNRDGLKLHGRADVIIGIKEKINSIIDDIKKKIVTCRVKLATAESDLFRADGYKTIKGIERETNTIIHDVMATKSSSRLDTNVDADVTLVITCVANSRGQTIIVKKGDITKVKSVDAIVNAASGTFYHAGGVDKAIADAAGPALDQECKQLIDKNGGLPFAAGEAVKTTAGKLPFKCVIHAIGPQFSSGNQQERPLLFASILSSLRLAENECCTSVALPAVSSHTFGFPLPDCTNIVVRAVKQFFADYPQSKLKSVVLLDMNDAACSSFAREVIVDHRSALAEDNDIMNYKLPPLTAKWCWQDDNGEKINDENHARLIETAFQQYLKTFTASTLVIPADNLRSGTIVNYSIHFRPELNQLLRSNPNALNARLVCGYQMREKACYKRDIIRYPVVQNIQTTTTTVAYSPKPLDLYNLQTVITNADWEIISISSTAMAQAERAIRKAIDDATISEPYSVKLDKDIVVHKEQIKNIARQQQIQISFQDESVGQLGMVLKGLKSNVQEAKLNITLYANDILQMKAENENELAIPKEWGDQQDGCKLVEISRNDPEFTRIEKRMKETMPNVKIDKIERVQNVRMWSHYAFRRQQLKKELCLKPNLQIEMELFHGTRTTAPNEVYNGEYGFDMTFSTSGMWGIGSYFAKNASYSCPGYSYKLPKDKYQAFFAQVLTGDVYDCKSDPHLRRPPKKDESKSGLRYNSVSGDTGGSKVYIVYENRVAYPTYLITFTP